MDAFPKLEGQPFLVGGCAVHLFGTIYHRAIAVYIIIRIQLVAWNVTTAYFIVQLIFFCVGLRRELLMTDCNFIVIGAG